MQFKYLIPIMLMIILFVTYSRKEEEIPPTTTTHTVTKETIQDTDTSRTETINHDTSITVTRTEDVTTTPLVVTKTQTYQTQTVVPVSSMSGNSVRIGNIDKVGRDLSISSKSDDHHMTYTSSSGPSKTSIQEGIDAKEVDVMVHRAKLDLDKEMKTSLSTQDKKLDKELVLAKKDLDKQLKTIDETLKQKQLDLESSLSKKDTSLQASIQKQILNLNNLKDKTIQDIHDTLTKIEEVNYKTKQNEDRLTASSKDLAQKISAIEAYAHTLRDLQDKDKQDNTIALANISKSIDDILTSTHNDISKLNQSIYSLEANNTQALHTVYNKLESLSNITEHLQDREEETYHLPANLALYTIDNECPPHTHLFTQSYPQADDTFIRLASSFHPPHSSLPASLSIDNLIVDTTNVFDSEQDPDLPVYLLTSTIPSEYTNNASPIHTMDTEIAPKSYTLNLCITDNF